WDTTRTGTLRLWNARTGELKRSVGEFGSVLYYPDGKTIAVQAGVQPPQLLDWGTGTVLQTWKQSGLPVRDDGAASRRRPVALSADGKLLACPGAGKVIQLLDARTGEKQRELAGHDTPITAATFSPDGK